MDNVFQLFRPPLGYYIRNTMKGIDGDKNLHEIYHAWAQPMHGRFQWKKLETKIPHGVYQF